MSHPLNDNTFNKSLEIKIPAYTGLSEEIKLDMTPIYYAESRLHEQQMVNPSTYGELSYCFNEGYRVCKRHISTLEYQKVKAIRQLEQERSRIVLTVLPDQLKDVSKSQNNADFRNAIIAQDKAFTECQKRIDALTVIISFMEGRIKVFENSVKAINKQLDIVLRSGVFDSNKYITHK
jgi:hypothetical protein